jgi:hypothetical protein
VRPVDDERGPGTAAVTGIWSFYDAPEYRLGQDGVLPWLARSDAARLLLREPHSMPYAAPSRGRINFDVSPQDVLSMRLHDFFRETYRTFPLFLGLLSNVTLHSPLMIMHCEGALIRESVPPWKRDDPRYFERLPAWRDRCEDIQVDEPCLVLANSSYYNYWHWMTQCLVNLSLARWCGLDGHVRFLVPARAPLFVDQTLELAGVDPTRIIRPAHARVHIRRLVYPSFLEEHSNGRFSPLILEPFEAVGQAVGAAMVQQTSESAPATGRLYLSRLDTRGRQIVNEAELVARLEREGFEIMTCSEHDVAAQVRKARAAGLIVSAHGAAMTNVGFTNHLARVLEILPASWGVSCFHSLARMRNQDHFLFVERDVQEPEKNHGMRVRVDIDSLLRHIDAFAH